MYSMKKYLLLFLCLTLGVAYAQDTLRVRVMTYNLRFGELASLEELAHHIKSFKPDFVALRKRTPHQKGKDFISELAYHTGMFGLYGKTIDYSTGYYGIGMLSKYPYISVQKIMLPHPVKEHERRAMLEGLFEMGNDTIVFTSTHLDVNSQETRAEQIKFITGHFKNYKYPVILGGDFNARHYSEAIRGMDSWFAASNDDFGMPAWKPVIKIDYLFAYPQKGWRVISTQTVQSLLSDHLPIITMIHTIIKYLLISATLFFCSCHKPKTDIITPAKQLIERQIGERAQSIHFEYIEPSDGKDIFEVIASDGRLTLRGSSSVAIC